jgi:hypothetical protein
MIFCLWFMVYATRSLQLNKKSADKENLSALCIVNCWLFIANCSLCEAIEN